MFNCLKGTEYFVLISIRFFKIFLINRRGGGAASSAIAHGYATDAWRMLANSWKKKKNRQNKRTFTKRRRRFLNTIVFNSERNNKTGAAGFFVKILHSLMSNTNRCNVQTSRTTRVWPGRVQFFETVLKQNHNFTAAFTSASAVIERFQ